MISPPLVSRDYTDRAFQETSDYLSDGASISTSFFGDFEPGISAARGLFMDGWCLKPLQITSHSVNPRGFRYATDIPLSCSALFLIFFWKRCGGSLDLCLPRTLC